MLDLYIIKHHNRLYWNTQCTNVRGFTFDEAKDFACRNQLDDCYFINVEEEIKKYNLKSENTSYLSSLITPEEFTFYIWYQAYSDNHINVDSLPYRIQTSEEYYEKLKLLFERYCKEITKPAFVYETNFILEVTDICSQILKIVKDLIDGHSDVAEEKLKQLLQKFISDPFLISNLNDSYAFRGIGAFEDLRCTGYDDLYAKTCDSDITLFRVRTKQIDNNDDISLKEHIVHIPYAKKHLASNMRFSCEGTPCLYLGATTYVCCCECEWKPKSESAFAAVFIPNEMGKKLKVLNLAISRALINGIGNQNNKRKMQCRALQLSMMKLYPLVIATSFSVSQKESGIRIEYLVSQALMKIVKQIGIDGIAYLSMKGVDEFQYPHGVNLALPAFDISPEQQYSEYCHAFDMSFPIELNSTIIKLAVTKKSYINDIYQPIDVEGLENFSSKIETDGKRVIYNATDYSKYDDFLCSLNKEKIKI